MSQKITSTQLKINNHDTVTKDCGDVTSKRLDIETSSYTIHR